MHAVKAILAAVALAFAFAAGQTADAATLVATGSTWRYLDNGTDQGTAWRAPAFVDTGWAQGPAQLGYGDGDEATVVDCSPNAPGVCNTGNNYITTYFRHSFNVPNPAIYTNLTLFTLLDDGAIVYINGIEVFRSNLTTGNVIFTTAALAVSAENSAHTVVISPAPLVVGTNVIAVEVHQQAATSSDISFDLSLMADGAPTTSFVPTGAAWKYLDDGSNQGTGWTATAFADGLWATGAAELGYGDGGEATLVNCGPSAPACNAGNFVTTYFRNTFNVPDPTLFTAVTLRLLRDDGAVAYLNGTEIFRSNMPTGAIAFNTLAPVAVGGADESTFYCAGIEPVALPPSLLLAGNNVLAVEVHQQAATSSDVSFNAELIGIQGLPTVTRGPYLQSGSPTGVIVRWRTNAPTDSRVRYGAAPGSLTSMTDDATVTTEHIVQLSGLSANTTYYYSVGSTASVLAGDDANHFFLTPPTAGTAKNTRIWVLGDSGTANANAAAVRNAYYAFTGATHTDMWIMLGDNAYNAGFDNEFQAAVFDMYPTMLRKSVLWSTFGNHEFYNGLTNSNTQVGPYYDMFSFPRLAEAGGVASTTEAYYSFDYANMHFICLNSMDISRNVGGAMLNWLTLDLAATNQDWIIAYWHHPPYTKGSHDSDNTVVDLELVEMRQNALPILEAGGVDLVLGGHSHDYERSFLINGHYGFSGTFEVPPGSHLIDGGDGKPAGNGAYTKTAAPNQGAVYVVAGSSGQAGGGGALNHPVMFYDAYTLGSLVLDVNGLRLDATFLTSAGAQPDTFTIIKTTPTPAASATPSPTASVTPSPTASRTASATPSRTSSPTASQTASATPSPSASPTASQTASATPLFSSTASASATASVTASAAPPPTASATASPTASPSASTTPAPTFTQTPTPTTPASLTPSPTPNAAVDWLAYE